MLKNIVALCLIVVFLVPIMHVHALLGDAELVLENVNMDPLYPKIGDPIVISADVYNAGLKNTDSFTSMVTVAYFVDGNLLYVDDIGNIEPGLSNKITITSPPLWKSELGIHEIKVIVDYYDTLKDQYDSPLDNSIDEILFITSQKNTQILLESSPQYFLQGDRTSKITISLLDSDSNEFLNNRKIILNLDGNNSTLITDKHGQVSFSSMMPSSNPVNLDVYFDGDDLYSPSNSSLALYSFPKEISSSLILKIHDLDQYNFKTHQFDILIFQDSYEKMIKRIQPDPTMLFDSKTFWVSLPPEHHYFAEIYLDGQILFVTDRELLKEGSVVVKKLKISGIPSWIKNNAGWWADDLIDDSSFVQGIQFLIKEELISVPPTIKSFDEHISEIPSWIKNNAGWWADDLIDDSSFVQGLQFMIKEGLIKIS